MLSTAKNIIFDLGGVIINIDFAKTVNAFREIGILDFSTLYSQMKQICLFDKLETGKISPEVFRDELRKYTSQKLTDTQINEAWNAMLIDIPISRIALLRQLKDKYRIFLLSNTNPIHVDEFYRILYEKMKINYFDSLFEKIYFSHKIGFRKPDKKAYEYVLTSHVLHPEETIFIDDTMQNIEAAKKIGINTIYLATGVEVTDLFKDNFKN